MERHTAAPLAGGTTAVPEGLCKVKYFRRGSETFRMLELISNTDEQQHSKAATASERKSMSRLVKKGLVTATRAECAACGCIHTGYSLTFAGRAALAAAELGLSFHQLSYLALARGDIRTSLFSFESAYFDKDIHSIFSTVFQTVSPSVTRSVLTRKGFLVNRFWHLYGMGARFAELDRHSEIMDELHRRIKQDYRETIRGYMQNPSIANITKYFFQASTFATTDDASKCASEENCQ